MTFYDEMRNVATQILTQFNQGDIKLVHLKSEFSSPDEPEKTTEEVYDVKGAIKGVSYKYLKEGFNAITDFEATIAITHDITPSIDDFLEVDGIRYKIIQDISVPGAGNKVVWKFIVRKGG